MRVALFAIAFLTFPAAAQNDGPIIVTGKKTAEEQIESFVEALTKASPRGQIARFEKAICPGAFGIPVAQRRAVEARIRTVATGVGLNVGAMNCKPNLLVMVTSDKPAFFKILRKKHYYLFGNRSPSEIRRLIAEPGPASAWQIQVTVNGDGRPTFNESDTPVDRSTRNPSRISTPARPAFKAAVVVVESKALTGLSTTQLADYAAMRAFARIDPARLDASTPSTILRILHTAVGDAVPITLTQWDYAFLKGLYSSPPNLYAPSQRTEIRRTMEKELDRSEGGADTPRSDGPKR